MRSPAVSPSLAEEFASGWLTDSHLAAMSIRAGEVVDPQELLELSSGAKTLFSLATLVCRGQDQISNCHRLWVELVETFRKALAAWTNVPTDHEPMLHFFVMRLERLCELATSRVNLYSVSQSEYEAFARRKPDEKREEERDHAMASI